MLIGASADAIAIAQPQFSVSDISNATDPGDICGVADIEKFCSGLSGLFDKGRTSVCHLLRSYRRIY